MKNISLLTALLLACTSAIAGNDVWQSMFKNRLTDAQRGDSDAQFDIGTMYQNGRGTPPDRGTAIEWYEKAAAQGNSRAKARLGLMKSNAERFERNLSRASTGNIDSQFSVASMYAKGVGVSTDPVTAFEWYSKAASQGHVKALYRTGMAWLEGTGTKRNSKKAFNLLKASASSGYAPAQFALGEMYSSGRGVKKNYSNALEWYGKALDGGYTQAQAGIAGVTSKMTAKKARTAENHAVFSVNDLLHASWSRDSSPVGWLPSGVSDCNDRNGKVVCKSDTLERETNTHRITYKSRSIIDNFSPDGKFTVSYRNLVIDAAPKGNWVEGQASFEIKAGWGNEHTLECRMQTASSVNCLKNKTHPIALTSPEKLANN